MLEVQQYLQTKTFDDLTAELAIVVRKHDTLPLAILNYDQIESRPKTHPIVRECRGLVLHAETKEVVAKSFNRFFNWGEVAEEMPDFDFSDFVVQSKEDGCFTHCTKLNLWGGGTIKIGDVVSKRLSPTLIGMDEEGKLVPCTVTDWHDNGTKDHWLDVFLDCDVSTGVKAGGHPNRLRVTVNHAIYVNGEYRPALELRAGDVLTNFEPKPAPSVWHYMRSSLLGDGSITRVHSNFRFTDGHTVDHAEYVANILLWQGECGVRLRRRMSGYGTIMLDASSACYPSLGELREEWYPGEQKRIPADLSWMDDWSVAKWYMDDGCLSHSDFQQDRAVFSTHSFSERCIDRLIARLHSMYGVDAVPATNKGKMAIRINYADGIGIRRFWKAIATHVVGCMRYKLPVEYRDVPYTSYPTGTEECKAVPAMIKRIVPVEVNEKNFPFGRKGFDITTTTHNYFAKGVLVHNSLAILYYFGGKWHANTRGSFATDNMQNQNFTWREGFCKALGVQSLNDLDTNLDPSFCYICEFVSPWNKVVRRYEKPAMYLLTIFRGAEELTPAEVDEELLKITEHTKCRWFLRPTRYDFKNIEEVQAFLQQQSADDATFEGVVIRDKHGHRWKIKSATYLGLHKLRGEGDDVWNPKHLLPFVMAGEEDELLTYFAEVSETFFRLKSDVQAYYIDLMEVWADHKDIEGQKDFALAIKDKTPFASVLFNVRKKFGKEQKSLHLKQEWRESEALILKKIKGG
jgi:hypothetical protein